MRKKILSGLAALFIAIAVAFNVSMNMSEKNQLSDFGLANAEALANGENSGGDGWTVIEVECTYKADRVPVYHRIDIDCKKVGPMSSCSKSCKIQYYENGSWGNWEDC